MNTSETRGFEAPALALDTIPEGTSILLTGAETAAIETVFYHLVTARDDERSLILATDTSGRTVNRELDHIEYGASTRSTVLACAGDAAEANVRTVDDICDLTGLGMQFSALVTESGAVGVPQRAGILLCSSIVSAVGDIQSVFRFLNANFLAHLRREGILGVCAIDTSERVGGDIDGLVDSMAAAFDTHIRVDPTGSGVVILHVSGIEGFSEELRVDLSE